MDELQELIIYRGYKATMSVTSEDSSIDLDELQAVAYSPSTGNKYVATPSADEYDEDTVIFTWPASLTALMPAGKCTLEFHIGDELYEVRKDFVHVMKASPADATIVTPDEEESSSYTEESSSES